VPGLTSVPSSRLPSVGELDDRRWEFLLREHQDLRSADQSFVQQLAALLSVVIVTAAAVAVSLENWSGRAPEKLPSWVWPLFPLPMLGVASLLVFLQAASNLRTQYAYEVEDALQEGVRFDKDFMFPSLFMLRREGWHFSRRMPFPPLLVTFWVALLAILTVIVAINVVCLEVTRPHWLQVLSTCLEIIAWFAIGAVYLPNLFNRSFWRSTQYARDVRVESLEQERMSKSRDEP
jgi:TRAP-type C4-dicarboxylate transport system permease small subunit